MKIQGFTDIGVRYKNNQDTYLVMRLNVDGVESCLLLLCDGMGGLEDGSFASQSVVKAIRDLCESGNLSKESVLEAINSVNTMLLEKYSSIGKQCGTTCSSLLLSEGSYWGYHIGDSRLYHFRGSNYKILTEDHTALNLKRKRGEVITPEIERRYRSTLSRCIGVVKSPRVDYVEGNYSVGDIFVACSDGFWHYWDMSLENLEDTIEMVKSKGERDNISVVSVEV